LTRIAILTECYLPYLSGVTVSVEALARGLATAGDDVLLVAPAPAGAATPAPAGVELAWLPSLHLPGAPPDYRVPRPAGSAALQRARAFRPQVVHANSPFISGLMARRVARDLRVPLVFTHHTRFGDYRHYLGPLATPGGALLAAYLRRYWLGCSAVVAPGSQLAAEIHRGLGDRRRPLVRAIPTGIDVAAIASLAPADPRRLAGWEVATIVVVSLGRLAREKRVDLLVEAFATATAADSRLRLLLVGGGPEEGVIRSRVAEANLAGRVHLSGQLPRLAALALVRGADLFAFASRTETQGLVLAEALAAGLPVVALDGPGVRDSVRDGVDGTVVASVPGHERMVLAAAMASLAGNSVQRAAMARAARAGAGRFDLATRIGEVRSLYAELLG
jgi:1,2-diacylglycerol 3-alpha-glucosyltransferase